MRKPQNKTVVAKINTYQDYFESELGMISTHLREFQANKEEFYRRWSAYADFKKVERLLQ